MKVKNCSHIFQSQLLGQFRPSSSTKYLFIVIVKLLRSYPTANMQLIFVFIFLLILFLFYRRKKHNYWKNLGILSPPSHPIFGTIKNFIFENKPIGHIFADVRNMYPKERFVGIYQFYKPILLINDPELVNRILFKDSDHFLDRFTDRDHASFMNNNIFFLNGQKWKNVREKFSLVFSPNSLKSIYPLIQRSQESLESQIRRVLLKMFHSIDNSKFLWIVTNRGGGSHMGRKTRLEGKDKNASFLASS